MMYLPEAVRALPQPVLPGVVSVRRDLQAGGGRHRPDRPGEMPRLRGCAYSGCPYQEDLLQLVGPGSRRSASSATRGSRPASPTVCSETCVGRIRYLGVVLYDAEPDRGGGLGGGPEGPLTPPSSTSSSPARPAVIDQARRDGIPEQWLEAAVRSPIWKMAMEWKVAFRSTRNTGPCRWSGTLPPLSPIQSAHRGRQDQRPGRHARCPLAAHSRCVTSPTS